MQVNIPSLLLGEYYIGSLQKSNVIFGSNKKKKKKKKKKYTEFF